MSKFCRSLVFIFCISDCAFGAQTVPEGEQPNPNATSIFREYQDYRRFIYDYDFSKVTPTLARSSEITGSRTSIYNLSEVYQGTIVARFYFKGFKDKYEGMNWKILWLVFEQKRTEWYLVGVVHGEWTI